MIQSAYHNGINFQGDFTRESNLINYKAQRVKNVLNRMAYIKYLTFEYTGSEPELMQLSAIGTDGTINFYPAYDPIEISLGKWLIQFEIEEDFLGNDGTDVYFQLTIDSDNIFSEIYQVQSPLYLAQNDWLMLTAYNNDNRHGFIENQVFGFFQVTGFNEPFFINEKTEYKYSYSRTKILSSENNVARRITFKNLTNYNQILLKWLCNCENLFIDGVQYELISEFTELLNDENSEIKDLRADFIKSEQSFFGAGALSVPTNVFPTEFFM